MMDKIVFSKINDKYIPKYQLITKIIQTDNNIVVRKYALSDKSINHLNSIFQSYSMLCHIYGDCVNICPVEQTKDFLEFKYIDSSYAYTKLFLDTVSNKDINKFFKIFDDYLALVFNKNNEYIDFYMTKEYENLFGKLDYKIIEKELLKSLKLTPFDMTANNLLVKDNQIYFIDYEWVFNFPVPVDLFYYHLIHVINDAYNLNGFVNLEDLYNRVKPAIKFDTVKEIYQNFIDKITVLPEIGQSINQIEQRYTKNQYNIQYLYAINNMNIQRIEGLESAEQYYKQREKDLLAAIDYHHTREDAFIEQENSLREQINILNIELQNSKSKELELIDIINKTNYIDVTKKYIKKIVQKIEKILNGINSKISDH